MSHGKVTRRYGRVVLFLVLALLGSILVYWSGNRLFEIQNIEIEGNGMNVVVDERRIPKNLLLFPSEKIRIQILADNPLVEDIEFKKKLPHTLVIKGIARTPVARLVSGLSAVNLDKTGIILPSDDKSVSGLPLLLFANSTVKIGDRVNSKQILAGLSFITDAQTFMKINSIESYDSQSLLAKTPKADIFIPQSADMHAVAATLQTLLSGFRIKGTLPTKIDLRFEKPIVTY